MPKILLACPVYEGSAELFPVWLSNAEQMGAQEILVASNSKDHSWLDEYRDRISVIEFTPSADDKLTRIIEGMQLIQEYFLQHDFTHWLSIEADNLPPTNVVERLLAFGDIDWISHTYPQSSTNSYPVFGVGCSIFTRRLLNNFKFGQSGVYAPNNELITWVASNNEYTTIFLHNFFTVEHVKEH